LKNANILDLFNKLNPPALNFSEKSLFFKHQTAPKKMKIFNAPKKAN